MPTAVFSVAPMPEPVSRYQSPLACVGSMPVCFHSRISALFVPLSSPREAKGALAPAIFVSAAWRVRHAGDAGRVARRARR